ncbi:MAG: hypothetical protein U1F42_00845 [Candidatus Competibacteraceae bacterium]
MMHMASLTLKELLAGFAEAPAALADRPVVGLSADSRTVQPSEVFLAVRGGTATAWSFWRLCGRRGRWQLSGNRLMIGPLPSGEHTPPLLAVPNLRQRLGIIASRFYGEPSQRLHVVGITGTDGKTSLRPFHRPGAERCRDGSLRHSRYTRVRRVRVG